MPSRVRMTGADAAWLRMDRPTNLMMVTAVLWFDTPPDWDALAAVVQERVIARYPRFSQRVVDPGMRGRPFWEDVADFRLDDHLVRATLPAPGDQAALEAVVSRLMAEPLDPAKPLWDLHLLDGYGAGAAVVVRMHHCIADGIALARVLLSITDRADGDESLAEADGDHHHDRLLTPLVDAARAGAGLMLHPTRPVRLAGSAIDAARALARLTLLWPDVNSGIRGRTGVTKRATWSAPIPLDGVREAAHAVGVTVNDLVLAAVAGGLHRYLVDNGRPVHDIRAIVPFNLRPLDRPVPRELGNKFGLVFLDLPVSTPDRAARVAEVAARSAALKRSSEPIVSYGVLTGMGRTPPVVERLVVDFFTTKGSAVMTNVPGPARRVLLGGTPVAGVMFWVPRSGDVGLGLSIFSYAGEVTVGLAVDEALVPDPHAVVDRFADELDVLLARGHAR